MKFVIITAILAATALAGDPWPSRLPDRLALCYSNPAISNRYQRLPASIDNLIALIRKVEAHPDTAMWTMGKMAVTLLKRFRYDGIVDRPDPTPGVVPVATEGVETGKYRLQWRLTPGVAADFPESSLTLEEQCSLHWMLSYTVNHTARNEERLPGVRSLAGAHSATTDGVVVHHAGHHEHDGEDEPETNGEKTSAEVPHEEEENKEEVEKEEEEKAASVEEENKEASQEETPEEAPVEETMNHGEHEHQTGDEDYGEVDTSNNDDDSSSFFGRRKRQAQLPVSLNPLETGIVQTNYGTVAAGTVLAGIAAGSEPQTAQLKDIIKDPTLQLSESTMDRVVDSLWVATLAGDIGQSALIRVSQNKESFGPRGQWNNTYCPREYALETVEHSLLTNAEFYGGVDGLLMAKRLASWDTSSYLKLSAVLEMYYSEFGIHGDSAYRACNRINSYNENIDKAMLKDQALNAALIMYSRGIEGVPIITPGVKPVDRIGQYVNTTMSRIDNYLRNLDNVEKDFQQCRGLPIEPETPIPATHSDVTFVLDQFDSTTLPSQKELVSALVMAMDIKEGGSRLEVVSSKDGAPFFSLNATDNKALLACRVSSINPGYNERRIAETLEVIRKRIIAERFGEKTYKIAGANKRSIIFYVSSYMSATAEKDKIKKVQTEMLKEMPDVHIMFVTHASPEEFRPFVKNFDRDIVRMANYARYSDAGIEVAKRLATVGARLSYPECNDVKATGNVTEPKYVYSQFVDGRTVQYYRIGAENFHSSNNLILKFRTAYGVARYCLSTKNERPTTGDDCKSAIKADETIEFRMMSPCAKLAPGQCGPIYLSVTPVGLDDNIPCSEKHCRTPDQIKFAFSHQNMRCSGQSALASLSSMALAAVALLTWFLNHH